MVQVLYSRDIIITHSTLDYYDAENLLSTIILVVPLQFNEMFSSVILMLTIHVYCPPSDVIRGVSESELVLDTMESIEFTQ